MPTESEHGLIDSGKPSAESENNSGQSCLNVWVCDKQESQTENSGRNCRYTYVCTPKKLSENTSRACQNVWICKNQGSLTEKSGHNCQYVYVCIPEKQAESATGNQEESAISKCVRVCAQYTTGFNGQLICLRYVCVKGLSAESASGNQAESAISKCVQVCAQYTISHGQPVCVRYECAGQLSAETTENKPTPLNPTCSTKCEQCRHCQQLHGLGPHKECKFVCDVKGCVC